MRAEQASLLVCSSSNAIRCCAAECRPQSPLPLFLKFYYSLAGRSSPLLPFKSYYYARLWCMPREGKPRGQPSHGAMHGSPQWGDAQGKACLRGMLVGAPSGQVPMAAPKCPVQSLPAQQWVVINLPQVAQPAAPQPHARTAPQKEWGMNTRNSGSASRAASPLDQTAGGARACGRRAGCRPAECRPGGARRQSGCARQQAGAACMNGVYTNGER